MCSRADWNKSYTKRIIAFGITAMIGFLVAGAFNSANINNKKDDYEPKMEKVPAIKMMSGRGRSGGSGFSSCNGRGYLLEKKPRGKLKNLDKATKALRILSKPRPKYTRKAKLNNVQGTVVLRVTFLSRGDIGGITVIKGLPDGLNEQAIQAARKIKFTPKYVKSRAVSVTKKIPYKFTIY